MADPNIPVDLELSQAELLASFADLFQLKVNKQAGILPGHTNLRTTAQWGNAVDNFLIAMYPYFAKSFLPLVRFGGKADGIQDDTNALEDAIGEADILGGGQIVLPRGLIKITNSIVPGGPESRGNIIIRGQGMGATTIVSDIANAPVFASLEMTDPSPVGESLRLHNVTLQDFTIDNTNNDNGGRGIDFSNCTRYIVDRVAITNVAGGIRAIGRAYYNHINDCYINGGPEFDFGGYGIRFAGAANANYVNGGKIDTFDAGVVIADEFVDQYTNQIQLHGVTIEGVNDYGVLIEASKPQGVYNVTLTGGRVEGYNTATGYYIPANARSVLAFSPYFGGLATNFVNLSETSTVHTFGIHGLRVMDMNNLVSAALVRWVAAESAMYLAKNEALSQLADLVCENITSKGRYVRHDRPCPNRGSNITNGDIALSAAWGGAAVITIMNAAKDTGGTIKIKADGAGIAANPVWTLTFTDGAWEDGTPRAIVVNNGGYGTGQLLWSVSTTQLIVTLFQTPVAGQEFQFTYQVIG